MIGRKGTRIGGKVMEYWDCDYYEIYIFNDEKWIRIDCFYYDSGEDFGNGTSRLNLYSGFDMPLKEFLDPSFDYDVTQQEIKQFIEDMEEEQAIKEMAEIEATPLLYDELTMETPCGYYVDWKED